MLFHHAKAAVFQNKKNKIINIFLVVVTGNDCIKIVANG